MMRKLFDSLTSRRASIALMIFIAVTGAIGAWVPQRFKITQAQYSEWVAANPTLAAVYSALGFDRIFTTWWFRAALAIFLLSLSIATWRMIATTWRRTHAKLSPPRNPLPTETGDAVAARAKAAGYHEHSSEDGLRVFWRHRIGLWAPAVMHAGMVVAAVAAITASAFTTRGVVDLSAGEIFSPGDEYLITEGGILNRPPDLGTQMRLDELATQEWPSGELKTVTARVSFMDESRQWVAYEGSPNRPLRFSGHTLYVQAGEFGDAAYVLVTTPDGVQEGIRLEFTFVRRDTPSYTNMTLSDGAVIEGRWDPYGVRGDSSLAIRFASDESTAPILLEAGETATLGEYAFEFVETGQWARLIVVRPYGIDILFIGFGIIGLGSLMLYAWIPRQLVVADEPQGGIRYSWRVSRMARAFDTERDVILGIAREEDV